MIIFKELIEKYPTWNDLRTYLESEDGGSFKISDTNDDFSMIRYEKGVTNMDHLHSKWFRSVVWNNKTNRPVCVAPPKASNDFPYKTLQEITDNNIICQKLLDGFMINCFKVNKTLHITSRSKLDAAGTFYSNKSFRELFIESYCDTYHIPYESIQDCNMECPNRGEVSVFYSFLVQHKEHRIVTSIDNNCVFIVHKGVVYEDGTVEIENTPTCNKSIEHICVDSDVDPFIKKMCDKPWDFQGIVFKDNIGNRWRFRFDKYNAVKALRGNSANIRDRFAQLFSQNLLFKYLEYYKEEVAPMNEHIMFVNKIVKTLYDYYIDLHIKKIKIDDKMFLPHLYNIHGIYLNQRPKRITIHDIMVYLQTQPWQRISFLMKKMI